MQNNQSVHITMSTMLNLCSGIRRNVLIARYPNGTFSRAQQRPNHCFFRKAKTNNGDLITRCPVVSYGVFPLFFARIFTNENVSKIVR